MLYIPATIALLFKILLLFYGGKALAKNKASKTLLALLIILTITNVVEIFGYEYVANPENYDVFLRIYYVSLTMMFAFLLQLTLLTRYIEMNSYVDVLNFGISAIVSYLMLFTDLIIAGSTSISYSVTRVPGEAYLIAPIYALTMLVLSLGILITTYRKAMDPFVKIQVFLLLLAVICLVLPIVAAFLFMAIGIKINAAFTLPIGITLFLGIVTYAIKNDALYDIRIWLPFSTRYKLFKAINAEFIVNKDGSTMSAKERKRNHEKIFLLKALLDYKGTLNQKEIAEKMGISESSLSKKRKEYRI